MFVSGRTDSLSWPCGWRAPWYRPGTAYGRRWDSSAGDIPRCTSRNGLFPSKGGRYIETDTTSVRRLTRVGGERTARSSGGRPLLRLRFNLHVLELKGRKRLGWGRGEIRGRNIENRDKQNDWDRVAEAEKKAREGARKYRQPSGATGRRCGTSRHFWNLVLYSIPLLDTSLVYWYRLIKSFQQETKLTVD